MKRKELDNCRANRTPPRRKPLTDDNNKLLSDKKEKDSLKDKGFAQGETLSPIAKNNPAVCTKTDNNSRVTKVKETEAGSPSIQVDKYSVYCSKYSRYMKYEKPNKIIGKISVLGCT